MIGYLGHIIRPGWKKIANHTTDDIRDLKTPTAETELLSVIGLSNVLHRFVTNFARITSPLLAILRKKMAKIIRQLPKENPIALQTLEKHLIYPQILTFHSKKICHLRHGRTWSLSEMCVVPEARRQIQQANWIMANDLDRPRTEFQHLSLSVRCCRLIKLVPRYVPGRYPTYGSKRPSYSQLDPSLSRCHWHTCKMASLCNGLLLWHSPSVGVKYQAAPAQSWLNTKIIDDFDVNDDISIVTVATCTQMRLRVVSNNTPENNHIRKNKPKLPALLQSMSA